MDAALGLACYCIISHRKKEKKKKATPKLISNKSLGRDFDQQLVPVHSARRPVSRGSFHGGRTERIFHWRLKCSLQQHDIEDGVSVEYLCAISAVRQDEISAGTSAPGDLKARVIKRIVDRSRYQRIRKLGQDGRSPAHA